MKKLYLLLPVMILMACSSESLSVRDAKGLIDTYTEKNQVFESTTIDLGERKLRIKKDEAEITALKSLESEGLVSMDTSEKYKKFLSKDSVMVVNIRLNAAAAPYVINQKKNRAEVMSYVFELQSDADVSLKLSGKRKATATAKLIKKPTPFAVIGKDKNPNTAFINRDFTLKYKEDSGWYVAK